MGALFSKPKVPKVEKSEPVQDPGKTPEAIAESEKKRRTQRGRAATLLSDQRSILGEDSSGGLATKVLLGG